MSVHRSLKSKSALTRSRNVLTRIERIAELRDGEKWKDGMSVYGLPSLHSKKPKKMAPTGQPEAAATEGD